jgi:predicted porin
MQLLTALQMITFPVSSLNSDENYITIEGGFGYLQLGNKDGVGEQFTPTASDLIGPDGTDDNAPQFYSSTGSLGTQQASLINTIGDENNITYILPSIGGLTVGASFKDAGDGASENADETVIAAKYEFESGAVKGSLTYADNSISGATSGASSTNSSAMGITLSSGPVTFIYAHAEDDQSTTIETEADDYGISYQVNDALTLAVTGTEITESTGGESLDVTSVALSYNITSGLDAYLTYHDYDYKAGTSGATSDDGSVTAIKLAATF